MRKVILSCVLLALAWLPWSAPAKAQGTFDILVVAVCGTVTNPFIPGRPGILTVDVNGVLCGSGGGGGGGGAVTIADGADVAEGATTNSICATPSSGCSNNSLLRLIAANAAGPLAISQATPGVTNGVFVTNGIATALSSVVLIPASTTPVTLVTGATTFYDFEGYLNAGSVPVWLFLYDALTATCTSLTNLKKAILVPVASTPANGAGNNFGLPVGGTFATGMTYCFSTSLTSAVAPTANSGAVNIGHNP